MILLSELYLFEAITNTPYLFESLDGLSIEMLSTSPRVINSLTLDDADFFFDMTARPTLDFGMDRDIDDIYPEEGGKESGYIPTIELFFYKDNLLGRAVDFDLNTFEKLVSRKYSAICKIENSYRAIFLEFSADQTNVDNLSKVKVKLTANRGFGFPYPVQNLTVSNVAHSYNCL